MFNKIFKFLGIGNKRSMGGRVKPSNIYPVPLPHEYVEPENTTSKSLTEKVLKDLDACPAYQWSRERLKYNYWSFNTLPYCLVVDDVQRLAFPTTLESKYNSLQEVLTEKHQKEIYKKFCEQQRQHETTLSLKEQNELLQLFKLR